MCDCIWRFNASGVMGSLELLARFGVVLFPFLRSSSEDGADLGIPLVPCDEGKE